MKVSVHLPNGMVIMVEASDASLARQMVRIALKELPGELVQISPPAQPSVSEEMRTAVPQEPPSAPEAEGVVGGEFLGAASEELAQFCRGLAPMGDMRRTVVAAMGADRYLELKGVSPLELRQLFDLVEWPQPRNFIQTLRNAARSKFRWLERVPGRPGYYSATPKGAAAVTVISTN